MRKVNLKTYFETPERYEIRKVSEQSDVPKSLVSKTTKWVGFDKEESSYAKFSKTLFAKLINDMKPVKEEKTSPKTETKKATKPKAKK